MAMQLEGPLAHVIGDFVHRLQLLENTIMIDLPTLLADIATLKTDIETLISDTKTSTPVDLQPAADAVAAIQAEVIAATPTAKA
jgi:hypothetical protein